MKHFARFSVAVAALVVASTAVAQKRELNKEEQIAHVLSRLTFGARPGDYDKVAIKGVDKWIDEQLRPGQIDDNAVLLALTPLQTWSKPTSELASLSPLTRLASVPAPPTVALRGDTAAMRMTDSLRKRMTLLVRSVAFLGGSDEFAAGKIIRAERSERQLLEVITDFWENHFSVFTNKMPARDALYTLNRDAIRPRALGKFRDLLGAVAHSPAMLFYLDNHLSTKGGLNENYARELLELHTLGVDGGYTQQDVIEVARALTGWSIDPAPRPGGGIVISQNQKLSQFIFNEDAHDMDEKQVLGRTLGANRGTVDGEDVLDMLARHPSTARFISFKLARRLVSDVPPPKLVERAAETFRKTDGDIAEVVRTIVTSPEFFSRAAFRSKAKSPFEYVVSVRRALGAAPDTTVATARILTQFGQPTFGRPSPDGWPDNTAAWMNAGAIMKRVMFVADVANGRQPAVPFERWEGWELFSMSPAQQQATEVVKRLLSGVAPEATMTALLATNVDPERPNEFRDAPSRLREMVVLALGSPEFQRR